MFSNFNVVVNNAWLSVKRVSSSVTQNYQHNLLPLPTL